MRDNDDFEKIPDPKLRRLARLAHEISERGDVGMLWIITSKSGHNVESVMGLENMDKVQLDICATSILSCKPIQDAMTRLEPFLESHPVGDRRWKKSISGFFEKIKAALE